MALTRKGVPFVWTDQQQAAFEALKTCLISAPILGFPTEDGRFILDTDASLFAVGVLNHLQEDREVVITFTSRSLRLCQQRYCMTRQEILAAVVMCTHFRSYLWGAQFTLCTTIAHFGGCRSFEIVTGCLLLVDDIPPLLGEPPMRVYTGHHCHITVVYPYINTHSHIRKSISSKNIKSAYKMAIKASIKCA